MKNVLILGGGFGGLTAANELAKYCNVMLIDRNSSYYIGLNKLWVAVGKRSSAECEKPYRLLQNKNITFLQTEIVAIDLERKIVETPMQGFTYDYLIIAMGAELAPEQIKGFENSYNLYTMKGAHSINNALRRTENGKIAILVSRTPFKCPAAPYEAAFLVEDYLRKLKKREKIQISVYTAEPQPMPVAGKVVGEKIMGILAEKNIFFFPNRRVIEIEKGLMRFEDGSSADYSILIAIPPHVIPKVLKHLCDESGWIPVNNSTLETKFQNVYAIGDCTTIKLADGKFLPKAGVFAEEEAKVVAHNIITDINGKGEKVNFDGNGYCFVETGDGKATYAKGNFFAEPSAQVIMEEPSEKFLEEKIEFERKRMKDWF